MTDDATDFTGFDEAAELQAALAEQERRVLNLLIPYRRTATPIVQAAGLDMRHFEQDDYRLMFAGWLVACEDDLPLMRTLRLIERALRAEELWDDGASRVSTGYRHSHATLAAIGTPVLTEEEIDDLVGRGPGDGVRRAIARHVTALIDAVELIAGGA